MGHAVLDRDIVDWSCCDGRDNHLSEEQSNSEKLNVMCDFIIFLNGRNMMSFYFDDVSE